MINFQENDLSLESQWRAIILFGKNSATYKFAFAKALLELVDKEKTRISLTDLSEPFSRHIVEHLKQNEKQGTSASSKFLQACNDHIKGNLSQELLLQQTEKLGFNNVVDAFQNVNKGVIPNPFYHKDYKKGKKDIVITDDLLKLKESFHFQNFNQEVEGRWKLVETAWNLNINPNLLEVRYDEGSSLFYIEENDFMRRVDITSVRNSLNGYQKGKCFYSFQDISILEGSLKVCDVDHFLPHISKREHAQAGGNINGVWNLVLSDSSINREKNARVPALRFLERLHHRNEFYIQSKHPLAETIINQTGKTEQQRKSFLQKHYDIAKNRSITTWSPSIELKGTF
ncbi:HNH endonuclease domain-containing protein [Flammeovirga pacifica]|uniref:HNH endonuclease n=1 Tax=Flammeovirga pacifica TaxID=915059 RepID=A0A1S1YVR1_FLAPC|nr:HNH endonuclease domain-containing protein [Flammeovirga pacifica]OHX65112.1 HNH endonuclease [Flammeovirga pacifica]